MKFSLISDMHINHPQPKTPYDLLEELVVVAGDTSNGLEGLKFLNKLRRKGHQVLATDGNHEHYNNLSRGRTVEETTKRFREEFPDHAEVNGVRFVLRNGWYFVEDEQAWYNYMNDGRYSCLRSVQVNLLGRLDAARIEEALKIARSRGEKIVVVTHTAPCEETLDPKYAGHYSNHWYWNPECRKLLKEYSDSIHVWCHGHTHHRQEKIVDGVRVVCNPRGYPRENPDWSPLTIEI